jgi:hypothetical protein
VVPLPLLGGAAVDADAVEVDDPTDATLPLVPPPAGAGDAAGGDEAPEALRDGWADVAWDTAPATGWFTTDVRPDEPASVTPG